MRQVRDLMSTPIVTIDETQAVKTLESLFSSRGVSGAPVLDAGGRLVGFVTKSDVSRSQAISGQGQPVKGIPDGDSMTVGEIAQSEVLTVDASAFLSEAARQMLDADVHHLVVTDGDEMVGILSSMDFVELAAVNGHRF